MAACARERSGGAFIGCSNYPECRYTRGFGAATGFVVAVGLEEAIEEAQRRVTQATAVLEQDDRFKAAQRQKSLLRKLSYAMRY